MAEAAREPAREQRLALAGASLREPAHERRADVLRRDRAVEVAEVGEGQVSATCAPRPSRGGLGRFGARRLRAARGRSRGRASANTSPARPRAAQHRDGALPHGIGGERRRARPRPRRRNGARTRGAARPVDRRGVASSRRR